MCIVKIDVSTETQQAFGGQAQDLDAVQEASNEHAEQASKVKEVNIEFAWSS